MKSKSQNTNQVLTEAQRVLISKNMRLAYSMARRHCGLLAFRETSNSDLKQTSYLALCHAAKLYDNKRPFGPYLCIWVKQFLRKYRGHETRFHADWNKINDCRRIEATSRRIQAKRGIDASNDYIFWAVSRYNLFSAWNMYKSIRVDFEEIKDKRKEIFQIEESVNLFQGLSQRERFVLEKRFGFDSEEMTLQQIANMIGVSRERVRQIENKAIEKLKQRFTDERQFFDASR